MAASGESSYRGWGRRPAPGMSANMARDPTSDQRYRTAGSDWTDGGAYINDRSYSRSMPRQYPMPSYEYSPPEPPPAPIYDQNSHSHRGYANTYQSVPHIEEPPPDPSSHAYMGATGSDFYAHRSDRLNDFENRSGYGASFVSEEYPSRQNGSSTVVAHEMTDLTNTIHSPMLPRQGINRQMTKFSEDALDDYADMILNRFTNAIHLKAWMHWRDKKFYHKNAFFSFQSPGSYQPPLGRLEKTGKITYRHLDVFHREYEGWNEEKFLDPIDGRVRRLFVQVTNQLYDKDNDTSWCRTYIKNVSPMMMRLAWWPYAGLPSGKPNRSGQGGIRQRIKSRTAYWDSKHWTRVCLCWLPTCIGLILVMSGPTSVEGQVRNNGFYDPVPYRFWSYPKSARNYYENLGVQSTTAIGHAKDIRLSDRSILPRFLCFLDSRSRTRKNPNGRLTPAEWTERQGEVMQPTYVVISYTAENQFERPCQIGRAQIKSNGSSTCDCSKCHRNRADAVALHKMAYRAATEAGVSAYWTDQNCMSTDDVEFSEDIYRISDVVRGAQKLVIVVGRSGTDRLPSNLSTLDLLKEWGTRMWTWPEILLAPIGKMITVYTRNGEDSNSSEISKLYVADQVWTDGIVARQLVDDYDNTLKLSPLEKVVLTLECLKDRAENGTTKFSEGDLSYALMGLLRQRPRVDRSDSAFQAFARLSLANDSDRLLERMICLLPTKAASFGEQETKGRLNGSEAGTFQTEDKRHYWTNMNDFWGAKLWDIEPLCQIAGIADLDTVILDGAYGATIHWDSFQRVAITTRETWTRMLSRLGIRLAPVWLLSGILILFTAGGNAGITAIGALVLIAALVLMLLLPILILHTYSGKVWNSQPWLFGLEGRMQLRDIERKLFGFPCERLSWAPYSSPLSSHRLNAEFLGDECEGTEPLLGSDAPKFAHPTAYDHKDNMRLFTIVDTHTMTVSMFRAEKPPVVALLCGSEGGMQRTLLCSYDWTTQTLYRESVLRMETRMLERMPRIGRVRFGLKRLQQSQGETV